MGWRGRPIYLNLLQRASFETVKQFQAIVYESFSRGLRPFSGSLSQWVSLVRTIVVGRFESWQHLSREGVIEIPIEITSPIWLSHNTIIAGPSSFVGQALFTDQYSREWKPESRNTSKRKRLKTRTIRTSATQFLSVPQVDHWGHFRRSLPKVSHSVENAISHSWFKSR